MSVRACGGCMGAIRLAPSSCSRPIRLWHWYCKGDLKTARSFQQANPRTDATDMDFPPPSCLGTAWKLSVSLKPIDQPAELLSPPLLFHKQVHDFFIGYEKKNIQTFLSFVKGNLAMWTSVCVSYIKLSTCSLSFGCHVLVAVAAVLLCWRGCRL